MYGFKASFPAFWKLDAADEQGQAAGAPEAVQDGEQRRTWAHVRMPATFLTPYTFTSKDGREFEKAYVRLPPETKVNGIALGGYSCDVFLSDHMIQQMLAGDQVILSFDSNRNVPVWTGSKDDPEHPYKRFEVSPWALVKGVKEANESFKAAKVADLDAAERPGYAQDGDPFGQPEALERFTRAAGAQRPPQGEGSGIGKGQPRQAI